jgi:hemolysin activation/secretion protein
MLTNRWSTCWVLLLAQGAWAQTLPSAGGQLQQIPTVPTVPGLLAPTELRSPPTPPSPLASGIAFPVHHLQIRGASVYPEADLLKVTGFEPDRDFNIQALQVMADRITQHYRQNGYLLARTYLPAQEIREGAVTLMVLEGQYGQIRVNNTSSLNNEVPKAVLEGLNYGDVIALGPLEERLLLLTDIPGVGIRSTLMPGSAVGLSDLVVDVLPGARVSGSVDADNAGNRYTGEERIGGTVNVNNPAGIGDLATLRVLTSGHGLRYARAAYQVPMGRGRVGVAYGDLGYKLGREFADLKAHGHARIASLFGTYPLVRSRQSNLTVGLSLDAKTFQDRIDAEPSQTDKRAQVAVASLYGDHRDRWGGGGLNSYSLALSAGSLDIRTPEALVRDLASARTDGAFSKLGFAVSRLQSVSPSMSLFAGLRGQVASQNLDVSEKMELGGMNGVRAYPEGEAYADEGALLTLELRKQLDLSAQAAGQVHLAAFIDAGTVKLHHQAWAAGDQRRHLSGAGVGVYWTQARDFAVKAFYARKLGSEASTSAPDKSGRFWVQGVKYF